jgi:hypothetical protein
MSKPASNELREAAQGLIDSAQGERVPEPPAPAPAPTLPAAKATYSHVAMVNLMVENPTWTHTQLAAYFGRAPSWMASVLASEAFQLVLDVRRHEVSDPSLTATMEERFRALALRSVTVLQEKLNVSTVNDLVVLKAAEIGVKALGMGQKQPDAPPPAKPENSSQTVAEKLLQAMDARDRSRSNSQAIDVEAVEVHDDV